MATLGNTSVGGTNSALSPANEWAIGPFTATENGSVTELAVYGDTGVGVPVKLGLYEDNGSNYPGELLAATGEIASAAGWKTGAVSADITVGTKYWIGLIHTGGTFTSKYNAGTGLIKNIAGVYASGLTDPYPAGASNTSNRDYSVYLTYTPVATLTVDADPWELVGMGPDKPASTSISLSGIASAFTGAIEASFNGSSYATIATITEDGPWSGNLTVSAGRGTLTVREVANPSNSVSVANFGVGDLYLVSGDSLSEGRLTSTQSNGLVFSKPSVFRQDDIWIEANDPVDVSSTIGSHWPILATYLSTDYTRPVGFVTTGTGSRDLAGSDANKTYYSKPNGGYTLITTQASKVSGNFAGMLLHFGPNAALSSPNLTQAQYLTALETFSDDIKADIQSDIPIYIGVMGRSNSSLAGNEAIRMAIAEAIAGGKFEAGPNYITENWSDGVHPKTDLEGVIAAAKWFAALRGIASPKVIAVETTSSGLRITVDSDLDTDISTYAVALFSVDGVNPISATRSGTRSINLVFASPPAVGETIKILPAETAITAGTANTPGSAKLDLPVTLQSTSTISQPIDPIIATITLGGVINIEVLGTRAGVLRFPKEAANLIQNNPPGLDSPLTDEVLSTREGVLRFPNEVASWIRDN